MFYTSQKHSTSYEATFYTSQSADSECERKITAKYLVENVFRVTCMTTHPCHGNAIRRGNTSELQQAVRKC